MFESGAIIIYLGEKSGKFYDKDQRTIINQWLMGQMAYVGTHVRSTHQFHHYNPAKVNLVKKDISKFQSKSIKILMKGYLSLNF